MIRFDNRARQKPKGEPAGSHFTFNANGKRIVYCYIRKNACSSFKDIIVAGSPHGGELANSTSRLHFLRSYHARQGQEIESFDHSVFVVRETMQRIISVYRNKFIQRRGNHDIFASYASRTGRDPELASFRDLVEDYLSHPLASLDSHVWPQAGHLEPAVYSDAILLHDLHRRMSGIIGPELADRFFLKKVNSTSSEKNVVVEQAWSLPSRDLHAFYIESGAMPETACLITPALHARIQEIYAEDFALHHAVSTGAGRISGERIQTAPGAES